jgi:glycosyltransferase involved in cell wall biosynthesis
VFGELGAWHPLRSLGRRPILFTVAVPGQVGDRALLDKVTLFAAETEKLSTLLMQAGVGRERIRVIAPGIDLAHFRPAPFPDGRFTLLFASSPSRSEDLAARGIPLLVELARAVPDIDLVLLCRRWGDLSRTQAALSALDLPRNVLVQWADLTDPRQAYWKAHAIVCAFAEGHGKSCPNSVIEAMACGRPSLVTESIGIADTLLTTGGAVVTSRSVAALADGVHQLVRTLDAQSIEARCAAEQLFNSSEFQRRYAEAYRDCQS